MDYLPRGVLLKRKMRKQNAFRKKLLTVLIVLLVLSIGGFCGTVLWTSAHRNPNLQLLGRIQIPSVRLDIPIYEGVDEEVLKQGAGHLKTSASIGQAGNTVLSGYGLKRGHFFNRLDLVQTGDEIILENIYRRRYVYEVASLRFISKEEARNIISDPAEYRLTLVTTAKEDPNQRVLVEALRREAGQG